MTYRATEHLGLTSFQKELWLAHLALPGEHPGISNGAVFTIEGCCPDREILLDALTRLKACFPLIGSTLRATDDGFPVFETGVHPEPDLEFMDFRSEPDPESSARKWIDEFKERPFSPLGGRLYRCSLIYLTDELSWFAYYCFHLAGDGFFVISQVHLMMACYDALKNGKVFNLNPAPSWQEDVEKDLAHQASPLRLQHRDEWTGYLKGLPPERIFLPRIQTRESAVGPDNGMKGSIAHLNRYMSTSAARQIRELSEVFGVNFSHICIVLHLVVLSRLYDSHCVNIQVPLRFGEKRDFTKIQGHRVQIAPLIAHIDGNTTFASLVRDTRKSFRQIAKLAQTPFQDSLRPLARGRDMSHIWDTNINFIPYIAPENSKYPLNVLYSISSRHEQVLFGVYLIEQANREDIHICIDYSTDYFSASDVGRYLRRLEEAAGEFLGNPDTPVMERDGLLPGEKKQLDAFQQGPAFEGSDETIPAGFDRIAEKFHDRPAVKGEVGGMTYGKLKDRSDRIGTWLADQGLEQGQVAAVLTRRHPDLAAVILGIMKAGGVYLPVDPDYPGERIAHMLEDSGAGIILSTEQTTSFGKEKGWNPESGIVQSGLLKKSFVPIPRELPPADPGKLKGLTIAPESPAYLIYTSGSTGLPKGVLIAHRGFLNMTFQQIAAFGQTREDRVLQFASPSFDASMAEMFSAILSGGCLYPVSRELIDDPVELKRYMEQNAISVATFPPSYLRLFDKTPFAGLKILITAGEPPILEDARYYGRHLRYFNAYGPTEASVCASVNRFDPDTGLVTGIIGKPIGNTRAYILDSRGRRKAPGFAGELCLGGIGLAIGYLNRPELNRERFTTFSLGPEERVYRTGDLAAWSEDGELILLGRIDDQLKIRGHRIEPGEINRALESLPQIAQAACIGVSMPQGAKALHVFLILEKKICTTASFDPEDIMDRLARTLPAHMIPSRFHILNSLPTAPTGKVDRSVLEKIALEKSSHDLPVDGVSRGTAGSVPEKEIEKIFEQVLKVQAPGIHSDFFVLGGDSLLAIELSRRIFDKYRCRISLRELMKKATIHTVAKAVEQCGNLSPDTIPSSALQQSGKIPLNLGQWGIWAQEMTIGPSAGYNMPFALEIRADESLLNRFCNCLERAYQTQPSFRSHVDMEEDNPFLTVSEHCPFSLEQVDLRQMGVAEEMAAQWFDKIIHAPFELNSPPLARGCLARLSGSRWQLLLVFHHLIADGQSIHLLINACLEGMSGKTPAPVSLEILDEFARAEQAYIASSEAREDLDFWKQTLAVPPPRLDLFHSSKRPEIKSRDGEIIRQEISDRAGQTLRTLALETGATLLGCFTGFLLEFLKRWTGREDVAVAVPVGLRDTPAQTGTAGYFVNLMVVRSTAAEKTEDVGVLIRRNWQAFRTATTHSRYPFGLLAEELELEKDPSRWPITDIIATHIDTTTMLPVKEACSGMELSLLDLPFRGAKADYTFILYTRLDGRMELVLEYDIHVASAAEAGTLAARFIRYLDTPARKVSGVIAPSAPTRSQSDTLQHENPEEEAEDTRSTALLGEAWKKILGIEISADDGKNNDHHFLLDGGDSIKAIQLAGFLKRNGVRPVTPALIFKFPLFADLRKRIRMPACERDTATDVATGGVSSSAVERPRPGEEIPLLPIQARLFERQKDAWEAFYMVLPMQLSREVDSTRIPGALDALARIHEAFHLSFESPGKAKFNKEPAPPVYKILDMPANPDGPFTGRKGNEKDAIALGASKLFKALNPAKGQVFGAVLVRTGKERFFIFGGHHLVLDAVSLDICIRELSHFCKTGGLIAMPRPGMATWAKGLSRTASELLTPSEIEFWKNVCTSEAFPLKGFNSKGEDRPSKRQIITRTLPSGTFHLSRHPRRDLLATLGCALHEAGQDLPVFVTLEGHGREEISRAPDISQAVGWFTTTFPVLLTPRADLAVQLDDLEKKFKRIRKNGLGYGLVRQRFHQDPAFCYAPQITLNYLGRFFGEQEIDGFSILPEFTSPSVLPQLLPEDYRFDTPMDIRGCIRPDGCLELGLEFSDACLDALWVERLLDGWVDALSRATESGILESTDADDISPNGTDRFTEQVDKQDFRISVLAEKAKCRIEDIEDIRQPLLSQEGMLFQSLLESENQGTYTQQINFRLRGRVDVPRLEKSWTVVLNRHKALRTLYPFDHKGEFHCLTLKRAGGMWEVRDFSASSPAEQAVLRRELLSHFRGQGFDLSCGPLLRAVLIVLGPEDHELSLCFHHILMDGWCLGIILDELFNVYAALGRNREIELPPAPDQSDFRAFQARFDRDAAGRYWTDFLDGFSSPAFLASPKSLSLGIRPFEGELEWTLDYEVTRALKTHSARAGVSWVSLIQAAWAVLLGQMSGRSSRRDVVFGIITSGRPPQVEKMERMVGLFIQTLPVRVKWQAGTSILELAKAVGKNGMERAEYEYYPLADIQRDVSLSPLFDHILVFETYPFEKNRDTGGEIPEIIGITGFEKHPYALSLSVIPGRCLTLRFSSGALPISNSLVEGLSGNFKKMLSCISRNPDSTCTILESLGQRNVERPDDICTRFKKIVTEFPKDKALIGAEGEFWTYEELDRISSRIAVSLGYGQGGRPVAFSLPRGPMAVAAILGILKAGGAYLPLDEKNPPRRTRKILDIARCSTVILSRDHRTMDAPLENGCDCLYYEDLAGNLTSSVSVDVTSESVAVDPEQSAYIMFTSGSTGEPKGVVIPHRAVLGLVVDNTFWNIARGERMLQTGPLGFDASTLEIWGPLLNGGTTCFIHDDDLLSPGRLQKKMARDRITLMWLTASLCNLLADEAPGIFISLRQLFVGGEALSPSHMKQIKDACPELELINGYGPTENTTFTTTHTVTYADIESGCIPIGKPLSDGRVYILDAGHEPVADGEWGEICAAGRGLALGYIGRDALTRQVFLELSAPVGERIYKTGDIGRIRADGTIEYKGRRDVQVKVRGYRIELSEIETALRRTSWVKNAVVLAPKTGEYRSLMAWIQVDQNRLSACVDGSPGATVPDNRHGRSRRQEELSQIEKILKQDLKALLPTYMIPDAIKVVDRFPVTANGKLDRKKLERDFSGTGIFQEDTAGTAGTYSEDSPASDDLSRIEARVARVFTRVLEKPVQDRNADFFQLGGQSLRAMRMILRLNHIYDIELNVSEVMKKGRVKDIAKVIHRLKLPYTGGEEKIAASTRPERIPCLGTRESYPLSRGQERLWFLQRMAPENPVYGVPFVRRIKGNLDMDALQRAVTFIETRHDALRLRVPDTISGSTLSQKIVLPGQVRVRFKDCSDQQNPERAVALEVEKTVETAFVFGYEEPLFKVTVFRETPSSHVLLLHLHHIICDGWSGKILLHDLFRAYDDAGAASRDVVPSAVASENQAPRLRYVDYAAWQKDFSAGEKGRALADRCIKRLTALPGGPNLPVLDLPCSGKRPALRSHEGAVQRFELTRHQEKGLNDLAQSGRTTLFCVLLAGVNTFLYRHTGQKDILVGIPGAGREHRQIENLVGFFVNTLVLRTAVSPDESFVSLLNRVKSGLEAALADQACPFESLVDGLNLERDASRTPLFDVFVSFEDREWEDPSPPSGLEMTVYPIAHNHSKFDISFYFRQTATALGMDVEYSTDLFTAADIAAMAERFFVLLESAAQQPRTPVKALALMSEAEREKVLYTFNDTYAHVDWEQTIDGLFRNQLARNKDTAALEDSYGNVLTYGELDRRVGQLSRHLASHGVQKGTPVCISFERSFDLMISIFALMRMGAVYVPVVPELPRERVVSMAEDLDGCMAYCPMEAAFRFEEIGVPVIPWFKEPGQHPADHGKEFIPPGETEVTPGATDTVMTDPHGAAYVIFTSGSTGRPKGVCIQHRSVVNRIQWMQSRFPLDRTDVILQKTSISFDVSVWELFWWSWTGARLAQLPPGGEKDPDAIIRAVKYHRVTVMHFVPSMLRIFLFYIQKHPERLPDLKRLKYVFASGEALTPELVNLFNILLASVGNTRLHNLYGPTEATVDVTWYPCLPDEKRDSIPIGKPVSNTRVYILDRELRPVPVGVTGEIYLSGIQVARGYVNRPELNAKSFLDDPFVPANRMYRTGDQGRWLPSGDVVYLGRNDNQVKLRGYRIELGEVEAALERIPQVSQTIVRRGSLGGEPCLEAFLVCPDHVELSLAAVRRTAARCLPAYMVPSLFYRLEQVPLNLSGKADRKALKGRGLAEHVQSGPFTSPDTSSEPADSTEREVQKIWQQVLPEVGRIEGAQTFFEIGGTSFLAVRLYELLNDRWPGFFTIASLFIHTTIEKQVQCIRQKEQADSPVPAPQSVPSVADRGGEPGKKEGIAIIGMALRLADYESPEALWSDLLGQVDHTGPMPEKRAEELIRTMAALGQTIGTEDLGHLSFLNDISAFDCRRFGLAPADVAFMDPEQRLFLETALRALEDAGYGGRTTQGRAVGVFAGASPSYTFKDAVLKAFPDRAEQGFVLNLPSAMASRPGYIKDWSGPAGVVDTACSSSLKAVWDACLSLMNGECSMALAGGAKVMMAPVKNKRDFSIQSAQGVTRPFDENADGVGAGEGAVVFLLKPLSRALADRDSIRAVILGGSVNQDGRSAGMAAPNPLAQARVIKAASQNAGVPLSSLDFFEAHGTGTPMGDPIEIEGVRRAFGLSEDEGHRLKDAKAAITSIKGHFGHLDAAAGALGMARAVLSLQHGVVPGQIHFTAPNPKIDFENAAVFVPFTDVTLKNEERPWRCGVSAFGLSGINAHLILEQPPEPRWEEDKGRFYVICLSASSANGLCNYVEAVLEQVSVHPEWPLGAIAGTLVQGRDHLSFRMAVVADTSAVLMEKLLEWRLAFDNGDGAETSPATNPSKHSNRSIRLGGCDDYDTARNAVRAYLEGGTPVWRDSEPLTRLHLPTVPLDRISCWPDFSTAVTRAVSLDAPHFLGRGIRTPDGWIFSVPIHDEGFWPVSQHHLNHRPTLVGMAVVSLFSDAFDRVAMSARKGQDPGKGTQVSERNRGVVIQGLSWLRPLISDEVAPDSVAVKLAPVAHGFSATLSGCDTRGNWVDFATASIREAIDGHVEPNKEGGGFDLEKALSEFPVDKEKNMLKDGGGAPEESIIRAGRRWDCRVCSRTSEDGQKILARLELPESFHNDLDRICLHPAMADVAVSLGLDRPGMVPAGFGQLVHCRPLPPEVFAGVVKVEETPGTGRPQGTGTLKVHCTLWDARTHHCILTIKDLVFVAIRPPKACIHALEWIRQESLSLPPLIHRDEGRDQEQPETALMILSENGECRRLMERLCDNAKARGYQVQGSILPEQEDLRMSLVKQVKEDRFSHILWLPAVSRGDRWALPSFLQALCRQGFGRTVHFVAAGQGALECTDRDSERICETRMNTSKGECCKEPPVDAALSLGVMLAMNQEEPQLFCRYIELGDPVPGDALLAEVMVPEGDTAFPVFLDEKGERYIRKISSPLVPAETGDLFEEEGCVVFTGGLGAMSLTLAEGAGVMGASSVALLHRGDFSTRGQNNRDVVESFRMEQFSRLKESGMMVEAFSCDVTCKESLSLTLEQVRERMGPIRGVIHTAGVPGDGFLIRKDRAGFESVLAPKVDGLRHLHDLTLGDTLNFFVMASSRTALTGAPGQSDYTAANAWMDAFAHWRIRQGLPALSINWNTWAKVGMAAWNQVPAPPGSTILPEQASMVFSHALISGRAQVVVGMPGESLDLQGRVQPEHLLGQDETTASEFPAEIDAHFSPEQQIMAIIAQTLGYEALSPDDDFYALGGDSITGMQMINRINRQLNLTASVADLFTHSVLKDFVRAVIPMSNSLEPDESEFTAPDSLDVYPVTQEQLAVLKMETLSIPNTGYNLPHFLKLPGDACHRDFENALKALVERHEILRTVFVDPAGESPGMRILESGAFIRNFSLERITVDDLERHASELIRPFTSHHPPLFRTAWLDTKRFGSVLFFDIYHGLADARTMEILFADLFSLWQNIPLKPLVYQFKDAAWHQHQSPDDDRARAYWLDRFGAESSPGETAGRILPRLDLPGDRARPPVHTFAGANHLFEVPGKWIPDIRRFVRDQGTTSHVLLLSLWALVLSRAAQTREPIIAVASDSRSSERYEGVAGMFASLLPLKLTVDEKDPFNVLLRHSHQVLAEALRHRSFSLNRLLEALKPPMDPGRTQLSEVTFSYMNMRSERVGQVDSGTDGTGKPDGEGKNKWIERINVLNPACKGDIAIFATDTGEKLGFVLEYYADYFSARRMARMGDEFLFILEAVIHGHGERVPQFPHGLADTTTNDRNDDAVLHDHGESVPKSASPYPPGTALSGDILVLFRQLFKKEDIRETDSFFDLGGHSLLGLQIINRINEKWQMELSIRDLFENPSPEKLARQVSGRRIDGIIPIEELEPSAWEGLNCPSGCYPLSHAQQRLYVLQHTQGGDTAYNMPFVFECETPLDTARFTDALTQVCMRHEVLRTCLVETGTGIWQKIESKADCVPEVHRMEADHREKALALFARQAVQGFDLNRGPLLKTVVCHLGDTHSMLLLLMHHIIGDGWSMQVFFRDLLAFYTEKDLPGRLPMPPLEIQYKDYAFWQQRQTWESHAAYWKEQLARAPGRIDLPVDGPGKAKTLPAGLCKREITPDLLNRLKALSRQKGVSLATLLLTLFSTLLYRLTRQQDMVIGVGVAGRETRELEDLIGFFINILPVRVRMDDDTSLWDLLDQVHQTFLEALERQSYPFDLLIREVAPDRRQNTEPLVNVMFEYQRYQDLEGINPEGGRDASLACQVVDLYDAGNQGELPGPVARHDLTFFVQDAPHGCIVRAEFDSGILTGDAVETWLEYFEMMLESILKPES